MKKLQRLRESLHWTKAETARRSGLNQSTIGLIESGRLTPYPAQLEKLAGAFGLPIEEADRLVEEVPDHGRSAS